MPTKRLGGPKWKQAQCFSPEHNPPGMMFFKPGTYEHTCPACGKKIIFTVPLVTC